MNDTKEPPIPRATIIIDSNALIHLSKEIPPALADPDALNPPSYLDILPFLARNGFKVVVPEPVSVESCFVLKSGRDFQGHFRSSEYADEHKLLRPLLKDAARGEVPNLTIESPTGPPDVVEYLARFQEIVDQKIDLAGRNRQRRHTAQALKRMDVIGQQGKKREGMADDAILHMMEHEYKDHPEPVVVLTDDGYLRSRLSSVVTKSSMSTRQFIHALSQAGLFKEVGISSVATAEQVSADILPNVRGDIGEANEQYLQNVRHTALFKKLRALADDIEKWRGSAAGDAPQAQAEGQDSDRVAKFRAKYANRTPPDSKRGK